MLSILIPAFNEEANIEDTIVTVLKAASSCDNLQIEIIIINDGSTDKTKQIIACITGQITVTLHDGFKSAKYELYSGDSIYIPNLIWDEQIYHTPDTVLFSMCNT